MKANSRKRRTRDHSDGTIARGGLSGWIVKRMQIELPSLEEQQLIVGILENLDRKIEVNNAINQNLEEQAFSLFDQLVTQSQGNLHPLNRVAILNPKRQLVKGTVARYIDMSQLSTTGSFPNGWELKEYNGGMRFTNGDTITARITPCLENGKAAFIDFLEESEVGFGSTEYIVISSLGSYPAEFFYCLARYPSFVDYAVKNMNGSSGRQRVSATDLGNYLLPILSQEAIKSFAVTVPVMFQMIRNNSLENMRLATLRETLLPKLMSGELDVSDLDL